MINGSWLTKRAATHPQAAELIGHSLARLGARRLPALQRAYAAQPTAYFDDVESQIDAVRAAARQDLPACLCDLDAFNALTPDVENDAWYDQPAALTSMHLDTLLLGFGRRRLLALSRQIEALRRPQVRLLEVGSGSGWLVDRVLRRRPPWCAELADRSAAATRFATGFLAARGLAQRTVCHHGSLERLPLDTSGFDLIVAAEVLEHCPDPAAGVRELLRLLAPQGWLVVSMPIALDIAMHPTVFADEAEMLRFFESMGLAPRFSETIAPDESLDSICDVFPGFLGCVNATLTRA
jgi:SAM-dependent methyltransferase